MTDVTKLPPAAGYPPEEGCYLRGNDFSPVAVCVILRWPREETPPDIEQLTRVSIETGAALAGTLQTENVGLEKVICNIVANPNIRYLVVCGPESPGHSVGGAILALSANGVDADRRIIGAKAPTPYLFNIPAEFIERFRKQVTVIDLIDEGSPDVVRQAVWSCYQENPTPFRNLMLRDPGAYPEPPLSGRLTWRVTDPQREPKSEAERGQRAKVQSLMNRVRKAVDAKRGEGGANCPPGPVPAKLRVLFLCTGNSCRSQMAEGWARALKGDLLEVCSAGIEKHGLNPLAVKVMAEAGVDISGHESKTVADLPKTDFDYVVTVCGHANETCPIFPGKTKVIHVGFEDPPKLADGAQIEEEALIHYRRVRDEIRAFVESLPENLHDQSKEGDT